MRKREKLISKINSHNCEGLVSLKSAGLAGRVETQKSAAVGSPKAGCWQNALVLWRGQPFSVKAFSSFH